MVLGVSFGPAASVGADPTFPPVPPIHIHLPKPHQIAFFKVIVEGKATDDLKSQISGETGTCLYTEDGDVEQTSVFIRGATVRPSSSTAMAKKR